MKTYLAIVGAMCAVALTITVALMIGPTVWAVLLGIIFGGLASLPMMVVVILLIRRQPAPPPMVTPRPQPRMEQPRVYHLPAAGQPVDYVEGDCYYLPAEQRRR